MNWVYVIDAKLREGSCRWCSEPHWNCLLLLTLIFRDYKQAIRFNTWYLRSSINIESNDKHKNHNIFKTVFDFLKNYHDDFCLKWLDECLSKSS